MSYEYTGFLYNNIAPVGAKRIVVHNTSNEEVSSIGLGNLSRPVGEKLYSFGLISDLHIQSNNSFSIRLNNAMNYFKNQGVKFVCNCGDMTNHGFWNSDGTKDLTQFAEYKRIKDLYNIPLYGICGNHDNYFKPITETLTDLQTYTGQGLYYSIAQGNDIFVFLGQPTSATPMSDECFSWLKTLLSSNADKRFFIFVHPYLDSGNANNSYGNNLFGSWAKTAEFKTLLSGYKTLLFHGHSHITFEHQEEDKTANYTNNGFHSIHVPSICGYREIVTGEKAYDSLGYLVDVYKDYIILNGRSMGYESNGNMINPSWVSLGTFKIDIV